MLVVEATSPPPVATIQLTARLGTPFPASSTSRTTSGSASSVPAPADWSFPDTRWSWSASPDKAVAVNVRGDPERPLLDAVADCAPVEEPRVQEVSARPSGPVTLDAGSTLPLPAL